jgi:6-phosphogluconolactonase/glucosamine-6-phosphate isomerase/deaminase
MYSLLASDPTSRGQVQWDKIHLFWGGERHVAPDHSDSNFRKAHEELLSIFRLRKCTSSFER